MGKNYILKELKLQLAVFSVRTSRTQIVMQKVLKQPVYEVGKGVQLPRLTHILHLMSFNSQLSFQQATRRTCFCLFSDKQVTESLFTQMSTLINYNLDREHCCGRGVKPGKCKCFRTRLCQPLKQENNATLELLGIGKPLHSQMIIFYLTEKLLTFCHMVSSINFFS